MQQFVINGHKSIIQLNTCLLPRLLCEKLMSSSQCDGDVSLQVTMGKEGGSIATNTVQVTKPTKNQTEEEKSPCSEEVPRSISFECPQNGEKNTSFFGTFFKESFGRSLLISDLKKCLYRLIWWQRSRRGKPQNRIWGLGGDWPIRRKESGRPADTKLGDARPPGFVVVVTPWRLYRPLPSAAAFNKRAGFLSDTRDAEKQLTPIPIPNDDTPMERGINPVSLSRVKFRGIIVIVRSANPGL